jgi:hypothetical protein
MATLKQAVAEKMASWSRNAENAIARLIIEGKYSQIKTWTNIYGEQMTQATYVENGKVVDGLGYIPRERAVEMYRQYKATGKIRMSW